MASSGVAGPVTAVATRQAGCNIPMSWSSTLWSGSGATGMAGSWRMRSRARSIDGPRQLRAVGADDHRRGQLGDPVDPTAELGRVDDLVPRAEHRGERHARLGEHLGRHLGDVVDEAEHRRAEGIARPVDAGLGVVQAAGGGRVPRRRADGDERAVAGVERLAVADPALAVDRQLHLAGHPLGREPAGDERRVRAQLEHHVEVAGVIGVVVGEEDPLHVLRLDEPEDLLGPRLAQQLGVGVDDHRLGALDHERVDVHGDGCARRLAERADEVRALGDAQGVREGDRHLHAAVLGPPPRGPDMRRPRHAMRTA